MNSNRKSLPCTLAFLWGKETFIYYMSSALILFCNLSAGALNIFDPQSFLSRFLWWEIWSVSIVHPEFSSRSLRVQVAWWKLIVLNVEKYLKKKKKKKRLVSSCGSLLALLTQTLHNELGKQWFCMITELPMLLSICLFGIKRMTLSSEQHNLT